MSKPEDDDIRIYRETRTYTSKGFKYEVSIAFDGKPDLTKLDAAFLKEYELKWDSVPREQEWEYIVHQVSYKNDYTSVDLHHFTEPCKTHPDDLILMAFNGVCEQKGEPLTEWYRVKLYIVCDEEDLDPREVQEDFDEVLTQFLGSGRYKEGKMRFISVRKINKFPSEGRLIKSELVGKIPIKKILEDLDAKAKLVDKKPVSSGP